MANPSRIQLLILDVDGVLTDGSLWYSARGEELKRFHVRDGLGIKLWKRAGFEVAIISARQSEAVTRRMQDLGVSLIRQGVADKASELKALCSSLNLAPDQAAFMGDDWQDAEAMLTCGYAMSAADADPRVRGLAAFVTTAAGGRGAVREAVEHLLAAKGLLGTIAGTYYLPDAR